MNHLRLLQIRFYLVDVVQTAAVIEFTCYLKLVTIMCGSRTQNIFIQEHFLSEFMHHSTLGPIHLMVAGVALPLFQFVTGHGSHILIQSSAVNEYWALYTLYLEKAQEIVCGVSCQKVV